MSTPVRAVGFVAALAAVFALALGLGRLVGPVADRADAASSGGHDMSRMPGGPGEPTTAPSGAAGAGDHVPGGLQVSQGGFTFALSRTTFAPGAATPVSFTIEGRDGRPVTAYTPQHEKELHLIAVRRDFSGFQHVHPTRAADGTWSTRLDLTPGSWRLFADFAARGAEPLTLGADLVVSGDVQPAPVPGRDVRTASVDGYTVTLQGDVAPGADSELTLSVSKGGRPVTDLDPYLGAYGHLVALRTGDLAYLHVHPEGEPGDGTTRPGPDITFGTSVPSVGTYRLFLDFQHEGVVRTAEFVLTAGGASEPSAPTSSPTSSPEPTASGGSSDHQH
ncbi:hypothetical protein BCF74_12640 [Knoellia remsis]|uniref:Secreted protein n=1 Tax=Knoellia remsis TaxID=407159 RepID=A0A2T0U7X7_9MICO|nr:hypothetical protein [Knoellia remsis]PRY54026.1 hypothetical protein BCF74_12640 [Knoellia remsis]